MNTPEDTERALALMEPRNGFHAPEESSQPVEAGRLFDLQKMALVSKMAEVFAKSSMVKQMFQGQKGSPGHANCFLALSMALELDIPWMAALTQLYVVKGNVGIPGQMLIALANRRAPIKGPIKYRESGEGEDLSVTAFAIDKNTQEEVSYSLSLKEARAAGASGDGWNNQPKLRLRYRAATYLIRTTYPEVLLGLYDSDELQGLESEQGAKAEDLNKQLTEANK